MPAVQRKPMEVPDLVVVQHVVKRRMLLENVDVENKKQNKKKLKFPLSLLLLFIK